MRTEERIRINTAKTILSGSRRAYKSEGFISLTRKIMSIDAFASAVAENIFYYGLHPDSGKLYRAVTEDRRYSFTFTGGVNEGRLCGGDLIFTSFSSADKDEGGVDRRLSEYLTQNGVIDVIITALGEDVSKTELSKIYLVSCGDGYVNFPLLNRAQQKIVETENSNMLVQGVAGSGKTNVCVEKIVFCACRDYRGRTLYSTFSRGLLAETKSRVNIFIKNVEDFVRRYKGGDVIFTDDYHRQAIENKLGIFFDTDDDGEILNSLSRIEDYLKNKVDYFLIEDLYKNICGDCRVAGENEFLGEYLGDKNHRLSGALEKIKHISAEIIYKEIYGMIFGKYDVEKPAAMMTREEYVLSRKDSFTPSECDVIYSVACDYAEFLKKRNLTDNNAMSRELIQNITSPLYSIGILDEVQDFTQVNLATFKRACRKLFCVGDALQMINPSYFSFAYLKRLMYGDVTGVTELKHNYRSSEKIEKIAQKLGELNVQRFGTHSFALKGESVSSSISSAAVFVKEKNFADLISDKKFENVTVVVADRKKKEQLRNKLKKTEILTVAEAKGLERNTVILVDVLSDNIEKWNYLQNLSLNRKTADENSVFRYYFNLFYVGISRAKQYLFVAEGNYPKTFEGLFNERFDRRTRDSALKLLKDVAGKIEIDDEELVERIEKFCALEQYENARFAADRLSTDEKRDELLADIYVHENFLRYSRTRDAGVEYWKRGYDEKAREMFTLSGDEKLFPLMDACRQGGGALDVDIVRFYPVVEDNEVAKKLILETLRGDVEKFNRTQKQINETFKRTRR